MTRPAHGSVAARSQRTRDELLAAGHRLLVEGPASGIFGHLTASRVAGAADQTTGAFFHEWPTWEAYLLDLVAFGLHPDRSIAVDAMAEVLGMEIDRGTSLTEAMIIAGRETPAVTAHSPQNIVELLAWNRALHDEDFRAEIAKHYPEVDAASASLCAVFISMLGREVREPFTLEIVATVSAAVAQGLAVRNVLTPGFYPEDLYGWLVLTLTTLMTRDPDDQRDAAQFVADLGLEASATVDDQVEGLE